MRENKKEAAHQFEVAELRRKAKDFHQPRPVGWNKSAIHRRYTERRFFCIPYRYLQGITMRPVPCNYDVIQHISALSRRYPGEDRGRRCVCGLLAKKNTRRTKLTGNLTGLL